MNNQTMDPSIISNPEVSLNLVLNTPTMKVNELSNIHVGEILKLNQKIGGQLALEVNGKIIARVELVASDGCYAIKIQEITGG